MDYNEYNDDVKWDKYFEVLAKVFTEVYRVLKSSGRLGINIMPMITEGIPTNVRIISLMEDIGFKWRQTVIWNKQFSGGGTEWGSWKSPSAPYPKQSWEYIEVFYKGDWKKEGKNEDIDITREEFLKYIDSMWTVVPETKMKRYGHPAMFPEELVYRFLKLFTYKGSIILDPFIGVGTTAVISKSLDRNFVGIEISAEYIEIAKERLKEWSNIKIVTNLKGKLIKEIKWGSNTLLVPGVDKILGDMK
jgi:DNA modification methylase